MTYLRSSRRSPVDPPPAAVTRPEPETLATLVLELDQVMVASAISVATRVARDRDGLRGLTDLEARNIKRNHDRRDRRRPAVAQARLESRDRLP